MKGLYYLLLYGYQNTGDGMDAQLMEYLTRVEGGGEVLAARSRELPERRPQARAAASSV